MTISGWIQLIAFIGVLLLATKPMGVYMVEVLGPRGKTVFDRILGPIERLCYRLGGVEPLREQTWKVYGFALMLFTAVTAVLTYGIMHQQEHLPLNPQTFAGTSPDLVFNTAISFVTNNGSGFAGLTTSTPWCSSTLGAAMIIGQYFMIVPVLALAVSLARKQLIPTSAGSFPVNDVTSVLLLVGTVLPVGALNVLPVLTFGPIVEHYLL